jgi:hypothetical protein
VFLLERNPGLLSALVYAAQSRAEQGFLFGYLWTRLFLAGALRAADQAAIGMLVVEVQKVTEKAETTERKLEALKKQSELDATALNLAYRQLNPDADLPRATQEELNTAVTSASPLVSGSSIQPSCAVSQQQLARLRGQT